MLVLISSATLLAQSLVVSAPLYGRWQTLTGPGLGGYDSGLEAVTSLAPADTWAVGFQRTTTPPIPLPLGEPSLIVPLSQRIPLIVRWNGTQWNKVVVPVATGSQNGLLLAVTGLAADNIWAVGQDQGHTLIMHWDGRTWSVSPSPNSGPSDNQLVSVAAITRNDVWAVGYYRDTNNSYASLLVHWDGVRWQVDRSLDTSDLTSNSVQLYSVVGVSPEDAWVTGSYVNNIYEDQPFTAHWDGRRWQLVSLPTDSLPGALAATASDDVWAVGNDGLTMHWDGRLWHNVANTMSQKSGWHLHAVTAISSTNIWAVGGFTSGGTLVLHWDGSQWLNVPSPTPTGNQVFYGVAKTTNNEVWAVGATLSGIEDGPWYALTAHFTPGACGTPTPLPTGAP